MASLTERLRNIDRRVMYMALLVILVIPLFVAFRFKSEPEEPVRRVYDKIEALAKNDQGKIVLIVADWDPQVKGELQPQVKAMVRHLMERRVKFAVMTLLPAGVHYSRLICEDAQEEYNSGPEGKKNPIKYGEDWAHWGYVIGFDNAIRGLVSDIPGTLVTDWEGTPIQNLPMMENVKDVEDISYVIHTTGAGLLVYWLTWFQKDDYMPEFASGCTSIIIPENYRFYDSGQITGLLGGMKGAADYEQLIGFRDRGTEGMDCESLAHFMIMGLIIMANASFLYDKVRGRKTE